MRDEERPAFLKHEADDAADQEDPEELRQVHAEGERAVLRVFKGRLVFVEVARLALRAPLFALRRRDAVCVQLLFVLLGGHVGRSAEEAALEEVRLVQQRGVALLGALLRLEQLFVEVEVVDGFGGVQRLFGHGAAERVARFPHHRAELRKALELVAQLGDRDDRDDDVEQQDAEEDAEDDPADRAVDIIQKQADNGDDEHQNRREDHAAQQRERHADVAPEIPLKAGVVPQAQLYRAAQHPGEQELDQHAGKQAEKKRRHNAVFQVQGGQYGPGQRDHQAVLRAVRAVEHARVLELFVYDGVVRDLREPPAEGSQHKIPKKFPNVECHAFISFFIRYTKV